MRKTLEIIALVLTIVASLVAIIIFLSGRNSLSDLISGSTPTTVSSSSSSTLTPTTTASSRGNVEVDPLTTIGNSPMKGVAIILMIILVIISIGVVFSGAMKAKAATLGGSLLGMFISVFAPMFVPPVASYLTYEFLGLVITAPLSLVSLGNIIIYSICLSIAFIIKRWFMTASYF